MFCVASPPIAHSCVLYCVSHLHRCIANDESFALVIWSTVKPGRARRLSFTICTSSRWVVVCERSYGHALVYRDVEVLGSMRTESVYESSTSGGLRNDSIVGHRAKTKTRGIRERYESGGNM